MERITVKEISKYKNNGQRVEQNVRFIYLNEIISADSRRGADMIVNGIKYQIKSPGATLCAGWNVKTGIEREDCESYIFGLHSYAVAYVMTKNEMLNFAKQFVYKTSESGNQAKHKMRFYAESNEMILYLEKNSR